MSTRFGHRLRVRSVLAVGMLIGFGVVSYTQAQAQPNNTTSPAMTRERRPGPAYGGGYPPGAVSPMAELQVLPPARAAAAASSAQLHNAEATLNSKMADLRRSSNRATEMIDATNEERSAWDALNAARKQALAELKNDPTYQAVVELRDKLADQLEQARTDPQTTAEQRRAMAEVKLSHATTLTAMETSAISADPQVRAARQRLVAAGNRLSALRQAADDNVRSNADVIAARKAVQDAQVASVAANSYFTEARNVAKLSVDYAWDLSLQPRPYSVLDPYYGFGYGPTIATYPAGGANSGFGYPYFWRATGP